MKYTSKELRLKTHDQEYAKISKSLGDSRMEVQMDSKTCIGVIRGNMRKKVWINPGDYVLVALREFQDGKVDIIHKYNNDEVRKLIKMGEIQMKQEKEEDSEIEVRFDDETL